MPGARKKVIWTHLFYPISGLGTRKERRGRQKHATDIISRESYSANTGSFCALHKQYGYKLLECGETHQEC